MSAIIPPCPKEIIMIASMDNPSPKATTAKITDNGPKNTKPNVEIPSASHALRFTIIQNRILFPYKTCESNYT